MEAFWNNLPGIITALFVGVVNLLGALLLWRKAKNQIADVKSDVKKVDANAQIAFDKARQTQMETGTGEFKFDNKLREFPNDKRGI